MPDEEIGQQVKDIIGSETPFHLDRQALSGKLIDHSQHAEWFAIMGPGLDEVIGPDVVPPTGSQSDTRAVVEPETPSLGLLGRDLQPQVPPDTLDALVIDMPAFGSEQGCNPPVAITAIEASQTDDRRA